MASQTEIIETEVEDYLGKYTITTISLFLFGRRVEQP